MENQDQISEAQMASYSLPPGFPQSPPVKVSVAQDCIRTLMLPRVGITDAFANNSERSEEEAKLIEVSCNVLIRFLESDS